MENIYQFFSGFPFGEVEKVDLTSEGVEDITRLITKNRCNGTESKDVLYYQGCYYLMKEEYEKAILCLKKAIEKGDIKSMIQLSNYYKFIEKDNKKVFRYLYKAYQVGYHTSDTLHSMASYLQNQKDVEVNIERMIEFYEKAIELGNVKSMYNLGYYFQSVKEYEKMEKNFIKAIEHGDTKAMFSLANYYEKNCINKETMEKYYKKASEQGHVKALSRLGMYLYFIEERKGEAYKYICESMIKLDYEAIIFGMNHYFNHDDISDRNEDFISLIKNNEEIRKVIFENLEKEFEKERKGLSMIIKFFREIEECPKKEKEYIEKLENNKEWKIIGECYRNLYEYEKAIYYYKKELERKKDTNIMLELGDLYKYSSDLGISKLGIKYYNMACENGNLFGNIKLGDYYKDNKDYDNAEKFYLNCAVRNDLKGINRLIDLYEVEGDIEKLRKYVKIATRLGDKEALEKLSRYEK